MKRTLFLIISLCNVFALIAKPNKKIEDEINKLEQRIVHAILLADTNTLKQLWSEDYLVNNPRNNISVGREAVLAVQRDGLINYSSFIRNVEEMQVHDNMVITMGRETFVSKNDIPGAKANITYNRRFTNVWAKRSGKWVQIARHASIICEPY